MVQIIETKVITIDMIHINIAISWIHIVIVTSTSSWTINKKT